MSRTEKTTPFWTRLSSDPTRLAIEVHDHTSGPCDLPPRPSPLDIVARATRCTWGPSSELLHGKHHGDGCEVCTQRRARRRDRRRSRHQASINDHMIAQTPLDEIAD